MLQLQSTPVTSCGDAWPHDTRSQMPSPLTVLSADFPEIHEGLVLLRIHSVNQFVLHQIKLRSKVYHSSLPAIPDTSRLSTSDWRQVELTTFWAKQAGCYQNHPPKNHLKLWFIHVRLRFRTPLGPIKPSQCPVNQVLPCTSWIDFQKSCVVPHSAAATPQALRKSSAMDKDGSWRRTCTTDSEKKCKRNTRYDIIDMIDIDIYSRRSGSKNI